MKLHRSRARQHTLLISLPVMVTLILLSSPVVPADTDDTLTTADLLAQAGDLDVSATNAQAEPAASKTAEEGGGAFDT